MFITFEGIDGCGKSTQLQLIAKFLEQHNEKVLCLREPGGTYLAEQIRDILLNSKENISPLTELLLFNSARSDLIQKEIKPALSRGEIVLCDRFYDSTTAYQSYGRGLPLEDVIKCNMIATDGLKPNLTFFLDIPYELSIQRSNHRLLDRMENAGKDFFSRVIEGYKKIADDEPDRVYCIDGTAPIEVVMLKIIDIIEYKLNIS